MLRCFVQSARELRQVARERLQRAARSVRVMGMSRTVDDIVRQAKRLSRAEWLELRRKLERLARPHEAHVQEAASKRKPATASRGPYAATLALAGIGRSRHRDVSTNKNAHLAQVYGDKLGRSDVDEQADE